MLLKTCRSWKFFIVVLLRRHKFAIVASRWPIVLMRFQWTLYDNNNVDIQYIPRNMHTVFALLCFVVVIHWLIFPYPSGLLHWHCGNLTIAPVPAKQPWWIWISTSCEFIMNDCVTTTKQSITKQCAYFLGYTVSLSKTVWHDESTSPGLSQLIVLIIFCDRKEIDYSRAKV